jgi:AAA+ ATPase superfamily predicted ATPase
MEAYRWPLVAEFLDRSDELRTLEQWWESADRMPINLFGRRRVGKSWLFRRFAHGKPAVILVAERRAPRTQLLRFAESLEAVLGVRPDIGDLATLFRVLFRLARTDKTLVVVDEFPFLLPVAREDAERELSAIQAVIEEERDASRLKLVLCGSSVAQMEALMGERNPLHGRLVALHARPLRYPEADAFLSTLAPLRRLERYAVTGGVPRYLTELGRGDLRRVVCSRVLDRNGPLWNEAPVILEQELRQPAVYFSILEQLAGGDKVVEDVARGARLENSTVSRYLATLADLRIVRRALPAGAHASARTGRWRIEDAFFRFWFRYVFPYQSELETGLRPDDLWDAQIKPTLSEHVAPVFEDLCREWTRAHYGRTAQRVGPWWGQARHDLRRRSERTTEEIDIVGISRGRVALVGECRWRDRAMDANVLRELHELKLPALRQAGHRIAEDLRIVLFSRGGYSRSLTRAASVEAHIDLVDVERLTASEQRPELESNQRRTPLV